MLGDRVERGGVARGVLPDVEADEGEAERGGAPQEVGETPVGDEGLAGLRRASGGRAAAARRSSEIDRYGAIRPASSRGSIRLEQIGARELAAERDRGSRAGGRAPHEARRDTARVRRSARARSSGVATVIDSSAASAADFALVEVCRHPARHAAREPRDLAA